MALPSNWSTCTVTGKFVNLDGSPTSGRITFTPSGTVWLSGATDTIIRRVPLSAQLNAYGVFSIQLPATDDPDINPTGFTYAVVEPTGRSYNIVVPAASTTIELSDIVPTDAANPGYVQLIDGGNAPTGPAGGILSGSYPNPGFAADMATQAELDTAVAAIPETVRDTMGTALVAGSGVTITPNDGANTITVAATGGATTGYTVIDPALGDDSTSADAAFAAALTTGLPILITPGTYRLSNSYALGTGVKVAGTNRETCKIRYMGNAQLFTMTTERRQTFADLTFIIGSTTADSALFYSSNNFNTSWHRCIFQGARATVGDSFSILTGHIGIRFVANSGDSQIHDCSFLNLGVGIRTESIQHTVLGSRFGSCHAAIYAPPSSNGGMNVAAAFFVGTVKSSRGCWSDGATGQWNIDNSWFEGMDYAIDMGAADGSDGPTQLNITNGKIAATTACIRLNYARNAQIQNVQLSGDSGNTLTPDPIVGATTRNGVFIGDSLITGKPITLAMFGNQWLTYFRTAGDGGTMRLPQGTTTAT